MRKVGLKQRVSRGDILRADPTWGGQSGSPLATPFGRGAQSLKFFLKFLFRLTGRAPSCLSVRVPRLPAFSAGREIGTLVAGVMTRLRLFIVVVAYTLLAVLTAVPAAANEDQLKKVPDYDIVLPYNPLQHEVLEAMKRFFQNRQYDVLVSLRQLLLTAAVLCLFCIPCFAGEWSVSLGMNGGDADTITGDLSLRYTLNPFYGNDMLEIRPLIECAGVYWKRDHDAIWGGGIAGGAVVDFWREGSWRPYVSGSFGGFMLSDNKIASHSLGCNFQFRTKGSAGIRFGESYRHDVQVDVAHFSNAGLNNHNSGFNTYGVSYGFRF